MKPTGENKEIELKGVSTDGQVDGGIDPKKVLEEIDRDFPVQPIEVIESGMNRDFFETIMPYPHNQYLHYSWPIWRGEAGQRDLEAVKAMGYSIELPREVYEANKSPFDAPWGSGKGQGKRIIRGENILAVCRKENAIARHNLRQKQLKEKYAGYKGKVINATRGDEATLQTQRDIAAEIALKEQHIARIMAEEKNRS